ncbi:MAG: hypothetical protein A2Z20_02910 [Bdellovibrionales bacterium RBG_16_40_8]|nr:MAG: hypothetical protein A2Z20_02910 [Bdellovibrionales bacterium RBG_16_40_8]
MKDNEIRFIIYKIGEELYGSPLLSVREVLEFQKPKYMPNMVKYFSGVINVRGVIVGVVDMRVKFGFSEDISRKTAMLLCDTDNGLVAAIVDSVECVLQITAEELDKNPPIKSRIARDYLIGVAKIKGDLITIVDLHKSLANDELKAA